MNDTRRMSFKGVPQYLHMAIRLRADRNHTSMVQEVIQALRKEFSIEIAEVRTLLERGKADNT
jgi:hypothetical protein